MPKPMPMPDEDVRIDFSTVTTFQPIPAGTYDAVVFSADIVKPKDYDAKKKAGEDAWLMVAWQFEVSGGSHAGRRLFTNTSLAPKALFRLQELLVELGYSADAIESAVLSGKDVKRTIGQACRVAVDIEEYDGQDRNRVKAVSRHARTQPLKVNGAKAPAKSGSRSSRKSRS